MPPQPFRFAVLARNAPTGADWRETARVAEGLGYHALLITDHLTAQFAPIPALTAAAGATTTLRLGGYVFANGYRNIVMFAKELATLDVLCDGRLDVSLGAGWSRSDHEMLGIPLDQPAMRFARMAEAIEVMRRLLAETEVTYRGRFYSLEKATVLPRPVQRPRPPLVVGASRPAMLRLAGRVAEMVSLTPPLDPGGAQSARARTYEAVAAQIAIVREAAAGRPSPPALNVTTTVRVTDDGRDQLASDAGLSREELAATPSYLYGSVGELTEKLELLREQLGLSYYVVGEAAARSFAPVVANLSGR